uniref:Uncharacterized protein n=1 Tax=Rhizophora mucronata TaxID=61149 RepID=A0A2P2QS72_RHIMU
MGLVQRKRERRSRYMCELYDHSFKLEKK